MTCHYCDNRLTATEREELEQTAAHGVTPEPICGACSARFSSRDDDNGPTGHGDICMSDADPGL